MKIKSVKVSDKGQISIPQDIREIIGIEKGDELIIFQEGDKIMLKKSGSIEKTFKNEFSDLIKHSESVAKKLWGSKEDDVWDKV